ncbi:hypothetical protein SAMN05421548_11087 [Paraburkholderia lycopersici]|uniref:Uncharacterized protein n=2 Tax=Paraburkholderia lycopersici TaxID=416944 RepID=A0A1G6PBN3_9BURK|nr:hypothetical protein SAMN05421548_11087 [Paraburkholderia lycopersici]
MWGVEIGSDVFARQDDQGRADRVGALYAHTVTRGTVFGNVLAIDNY